MNKETLHKKIEEGCRTLEDVNWKNVWYDDEAIVPVLKITIEGDWKHDHARAKWLLNQKGWIFVGAKITEDTGCDWYEAEHMYFIPEQKGE